jgi:hypothetical protein
MSRGIAFSSKESLLGLASNVKNVPEITEDNHTIMGKIRETVQLLLWFNNTAAVGSVRISKCVS